MSRVLVLKGWAYGVSEELSSTFCSEALGAVEAHRFTHVAWDGDLHKPDSFTSVIPVLAERFPSLLFVAFKARESVEHLSAAYSTIDRGVAATGYPFAHPGTYTVIDGDDDTAAVDPSPAASRLTAVGFDVEAEAWAQLAMLGYAFVKTRLQPALVHVLCAGGGQAIEEEIAQLTAAAADGTFASRFPAMTFRRLAGSRRRPVVGDSADAFVVDVVEESTTKTLGW